MNHKLLLPAIIAIFLLFSTTIKAQIQFSAEYGGAYNEDGRWMEQLPDSGYIMTGGTSTYSNGQMDIWLVRADKYGNTMWTKSIGSTVFDFANMIRLTSDGGFIIAGLTNQTGSNDGWLIKTDGLGNVQWSTLVGDSGLQEFEAVIPTQDGGYATLGVNNTTGTQYYDMFLVKFNSTGVVQWQKNIGGASYEIGNAIQQTADGGFILGGQTYSYGNLDGDYYMVKTDSLGIVQWEKTYAQPGLQEAHYVQITPDGGFIMTGDADGLTNGYGDTDIWTIRTNSSGDTLWTKIYGGTKKDGGKTIENTSDGGFIMAGITRSFSLINPNYYLVKTDSQGIIEWSNYSYGNAYHDHAYRGLETSDGGFAEFGYFRNAQGFMNFNLVKLGPNGGVTKDVALDRIVAPDFNICRTSTGQLKFSIKNYGATNEQNIPVVAMIDNGSTVTTLRDTLYGQLNPAGARTIVFNSTYNFSSPGTYTVTAYIPHRSNDISYSNDTIINTITVLPTTNDPTGISSISCIAGSLTLNASPGSSADSLFWYDASSGGNLVSTGTVFTTPSISSSTSYYVKAVKGKGFKVGPVDNSIGNGTNSANGILKFDSRVPFKLISVKVYANNSGTRIFELRNSAGTLLQSKSIIVPTGEQRVFLDFDVPEGNDFQLGLGTGSANLFRNGSGATFPYSVSRTVEIYGTNSSNTGTYYYFYDWYIFVPYENCGSNMVTVPALIGTTPTNAFDRSRCGDGTVTLTANSPSAISWYDLPTGGTLLSSSSSYTTASLTTSTTYYLQTGNCSSRIAVSANVNAQSLDPIVADETRCGPGSVTFNATSTDPVRWYDAVTNGTLLGTGNSFTTGFLNSTTAFYAIAGNTCPSSVIPVQATITSSTPPSVNNVTSCGPAAVTLTAASPNQVVWYNNPNGTNPLDTTYSFVTPILSSSSTFYAQALGACPSALMPVNINLIVIDPPFGTGAARCGAGSVVLTAQSLDTVTWWTAATAGSNVASGLAFTTGILSSSTTYYAQANAQGCISSRTPVIATVNITTPPTITNGAHCGQGTVNLSAAAADSIYWYDAPTGGNLLITGTSYTTPVLTSTTVYYVQALLSCPSVRVAVTASILAGTATSPVVTANANCGPGTVTLSATASDPIIWLDAPNGTTVGSGNTFTTPLLNNSTTYYAVAGAPGCYSNPVTVVATIHTLPSVNIGPPVIDLISGNTLTLDAGPGFASYNWSTSAVTQSIVVSTGNVYWVVVTDGNNCTASDTMTVNLITGINAIALKGISVFPNPVVGILILESEIIFEETEIRLMDLSGQLILKDHHTGNGTLHKRYDLSSLPSGTYFLKLYNVKGSYTKTIIIQ